MQRQFASVAGNWRRILFFCSPTVHSRAEIFNPWVFLGWLRFEWPRNFQALRFRIARCNVVRVLLGIWRKPSARLVSDSGIWNALQCDWCCAVSVCVKTCPAAWTSPIGAITEEQIGQSEPVAALLGRPDCIYWSRWVGKGQSWSGE